MENNNIVKPTVAVGFNKKGNLDRFINLNKIKSMKTDKKAELLNMLKDSVEIIHAHLHKDEVGLNNLSAEFETKLKLMIRRQQKLQAIKVLREHVQGLGLKDAKNFIDTLPLL